MGTKLFLKTCDVEVQSQIELSLIGHFTYRYIGGKYCDISILISIYNINIQVIFQQSVL